MSGAGVAAALVLATTLAVGRAVAEHRRHVSVARLRPAGPGTCPSPARRRPVILDVPSWLPVRLAETAVPVAPATAWTVWWAAATALVAAGLVAGGTGAALLAAVAAGGAPVVAWRLLRHRGDAAFERALPAAMEALASALRSGASLRQALPETAGACDGPLAADLARVAASVEHGAAVVPALEAWSQRRPAPGVRLVVAALCLGAETGGATAQAVDNLAVTLRQRLGVEAEARSLATQARTSAGVLAVAPLAFCALSAVTDPRAAAFLLRTPAGLALLAAGLLLDVVGALWMARIIRGSVAVTGATR